MAFRTVFKRYELKYMLTLEQKAMMIEAILPHMEPDLYGRTTVRNLYFDTDNYRLIRRSIEKPAYKEKLRIRSCFQATSGSTVFVELKKKYEKVVYKRRIPLCEQDAMAWVSREQPCPTETQISREIDYFIDFYGGLKPTVFLSYELADEPTGNLDVDTQREIMDIFRELANQGKCVILVSHSPDVAALCDECYELKKLVVKRKKTTPRTGNNESTIF